MILTLCGFLGGESILLSSAFVTGPDLQWSGAKKLLLAHVFSLKTAVLESFNVHE